LAWFVATILIALVVGYWVIRTVRREPPTNVDTVWQQAEEDFLAGRHDRVESALARLGRLRTPTPLDWFLRGQFALARKDVDQGLADLARVADEHYMAPQARLLAGQTELRRDRVHEAEKWFRAALALDPGLIQAHRELIYIYGMQLRRAELSAEFMALSKLTNLTFENVFHWCLLRNNSWEPGELVETLLRYVAADPGDRSSRLALAENYLRMGRPTDAADIIAVLPEDDPAAIVVRGRIALDRQEPDDAERLASRGSTSDPQVARLRGRLALSRREVKKAVEFFQIALASDSEDRETLFGLIASLELSGKSKSAEPFRQTARSIDQLSTLIQRAAMPDAQSDAQLMRQLGAACAALSRNAEARAWYKLAIARDPLDSESQRALYRLDDAGPNDRQTPLPTANP
jgi:tetratricopeptide (TPR) repeat protein